MKKAVLIAVCLMIPLLLCSCKSEVQNNMEIKSKKAVTFVNEVKDADVWILPQTEANLKTTVWGTATVAQTKAGESYKAPLSEAGDDGLYIFRMIDTEHFYYSANGIALNAGYTVTVKGSDMNSITLEVADSNGKLIETYTVFCARL